MQFLAGLLALSTLLVGTSASPIAATSNPPPKSTYIKSVSYAGSGCPAHSVVGTFSANFDNINVAFDKYVASIGPHVPVTEKRKNCQLTFTIVSPPNYQYLISETVYKGYVDLDRKVTARQQSEYWFQGKEGNSVTWYDDWTGELTKDYTTTPDIITKQIWSPCGKSGPVTSNLIVNTQIRLDNRYNPSGTGLITTDSLTHKVHHIFKCKWRKC